jgi:hypothetical protein
MARPLPQCLPVELTGSRKDKQAHRAVSLPLAWHRARREETANRLRRFKTFD